MPTTVAEIDAQLAAHKEEQRARDEAEKEKLLREIAATKTRIKERAAEVSANIAQSSADDAPLPNGWNATALDDGRTYYWHSVTNEVTWTMATHVFSTMRIRSKL